MRRCFLYILLAIFGISGIQATWSQTPQLTFRLNNPRILFTGGISYLQFEIEIKSSLPNAFLDGSTSYLSFNTTGISETGALVSFGPHYAEVNINSDPKYSKISSFTTFGSVRRFGIGITSPNASGQPGGTDYLSEVYTYFHPLVTVRLRISNAALAAQVLFNQSQMNGVGAYKALGSVTPLSWVNPHLYSTKDFASLYMGRLYNNVSSWTQYGGTVSWTTIVNTSVWDSTAINTTGSLTGALRIHPGAQLKINPGKDLTCSGATDISDSQGLWIAYDATGSGSFIDNGTVNGVARVDRYIANDGYWHYWSSPVSSLTAVPFTGLFLRWFDETTYTFMEIINPASAMTTLTG